MMRLGVFGGTFSPPHKGHIEAARAFSEQMKLDRLLIIPTNIPPHKTIDGMASAEERLQMCRLSFSELENACVSDMEIARAGKSYTYLTLEELTAEDCELYFLCGTDMILTLGQWLRPERIFELATVCYIRREADPDTGAALDRTVAEYERLYGARIREIDCTPIETSSSEIRAGICGEGAESMLEEKTLEFIRKRGLYL